MSSSVKQAIWQEHIDKAKDHPGGITGYCRDAGINISGFYQWRKRLVGPSRKKSKSNCFVPVVTMSPVEEVRELPPHLDAQWVGQMLAGFVRHLS